MCAQNALETFIQRLSRIPDKYRKFSIGAEGARRSYGIKEELLNEFARLGLSKKNGGKDALYDVYDLNNISLHFKIPSLQRMAMRSWSSMLRRSEVTAEISAEISFVPEKTEAMEQCLYKILLPQKGRVEMMGTPGESVIEIIEKTRSNWPAFPPEIKDLLAQIDDLDFFMLPEQIRWDVDFINETKMSECGGASKQLILKAKERNIPARQRFGLLVAQPYSTGHYWVELLVNDVWVPADPLLIKVILMTTALDAEKWTYDKSPGAVFVPLTTVCDYSPQYGQPILEFFENEVHVVDPVLTKDSVDCPVSFPTRILNQ
jgi:hypothetical protein